MKSCQAWYGVLVFLGRLEFGAAGFFPGMMAAPNGKMKLIIGIEVNK